VAAVFHRICSRSSLVSAASSITFMRIWCRVAGTLSHRQVVVTCGTCREALGAMDAASVFGCAVKDLARFALEAGAAPAPREGPWLYHTPCHDSLDGHGTSLLARLGLPAQAVPHCCSEAGTLALSRPDITDAMLHRKAEALEEALASRPGAVVLTNCPSCLSGLGRNAAAGAPARHVAVELARSLSGEGWMDLLRERARRAGAVRF